MGSWRIILNKVKKILKNLKYKILGRFHKNYFVGRNERLPDPRNDPVNIFLPFCECESRGKSELHIRERP